MDKKILLLLVILFFYFLYPTIEKMFVEGYETITLNIYGEQLKPCKNNININDNKGSWDEDGYCSEVGGGVHQICFNINDNTKDFSKDTNQTSWSENRLNKTHCMCLGAWALYKAKQSKGLIPETNNELLCESIPEMALETQYIDKWNTWNGHELKDQIKNGVNELYNQCYEKGNSQQKKYLDYKYKLLNKSYNLDN